MFILKKEFADARISVGKYRIDITKENVQDEFIQKIISETPGIHSMFESDEEIVLNTVRPEPKAISSRGVDKNED